MCIVDLGSCCLLPQAATESPFLDNKLVGCTAVLAVLVLPHALMDVQLLQAIMLDPKGLNDNQREYVLRTAIQVAAMTIQELAGPRCTDIIVCPQVRDDADGGQSVGMALSGTPADEEAEDGGRPGDVLTIECSLLALEAIEEAGEGWTWEAIMIRTSQFLVFACVSLSRALSY